MKTEGFISMANGSIETRGLLAGAYRGGRRNLKTTLTHAVAVDAGGMCQGQTTLCGRISVGSLADHYAADEVQRAEAPTCRTCRNRDPRKGNG